MPVKWYPQTTGVNTNGFVFDGLPSQTLPDKWLSPQIQVAPNSLVILGPDPIIGPQSVQLRMRDSQMWVSTDGLKPFAARRAAP
jgi:general secretion pathway protein H